MEETTEPTPTDAQMEQVYQTYLEAYVMASTRTESLAQWVSTQMTESERVAIALAAHHARKEGPPMPKTILRNTLRQMLALPSPPAPPAPPAAPLTPTA